MSDLRKIVEPFVRNVLGCGCPDAVFDDIRMVDPKDGLAGMPIDYLLLIGGRLLIVVCASDPDADMAAHLAQLVHSGRQLRDELGFNRFRLVVPLADMESTRKLRQAFAALTGLDDRTHLHVLAPSMLPTIQFPSHPLQG
ncbi:MAG: hypothetical protein ACOZF0_14195 [Thermodesulfobacteriota bacterium]